MIKQGDQEVYSGLEVKEGEEEAKVLVKVYRMRKFK